MVVIKVPQEILDQIAELKFKREYVLREFGEIGIATEELKERKSVAVNYRKTVLEEESILLEYLSSQYGNGILNPDTGEFQPLT